MVRFVSPIGIRAVAPSGDVPVPLPPKAVDTLAALLSAPGEVVETRALIEHVWPETFVEEGGLARNISLHRRTLGVAEAGSEYIETIPRLGYRFVAPVRGKRLEGPAHGNFTTFRPCSGQLVRGGAAWRTRPIRAGVQMPPAPLQRPTPRRVQVCGGTETERNQQLGIGRKAKKPGVARAKPPLTRPLECRNGRKTKADLKISVDQRQPSLGGRYPATVIREARTRAAAPWSGGPGLARTRAYALRVAVTM